ncbi:magnesium transporter [Candidatus Saccharibacteria bacterium]|nr:magnesium transporter [Candidatus Saccharibacteria bacterium]
MIKKERLKQSFFYTCLMVAAASSVSLIGGIGLEAISEKLLPIIPLLIATPPLNTMVGDYASVIAARATDGKLRNHPQLELARDLAPSIMLNASAVSVVSLGVAISRHYALSTVFLSKFIIFVFASIIGVVVAMLIITKTVDKLLESKTANPDDVLIPIVTSVTDVLMLGLITAAALWLF